MKTKFFISAIALVILQFSFSQDSLSAQQIADYQNKLMDKELNLNEEQQKIVSEINLRYSKQQKSLIEKEGSMLGKMGDFRKLKKSKDTELESILTESQFEKYKDDLEPQIRKYMRKNMDM